MRKIALITLTLVVCLMSCKKSESTFKEFTKDGYSISHPESWEVDTSGQMNTSVLLFSEQTSSSDDFRENVNVIVQDLRGQKMTVEQFGEMSKKQVSSPATNGEVLQSGLTADGNKYEMVWKAIMNNKDLKFKQSYSIKDGKVYLVTFTAKKDTYDDYIKEGDKILNSFKIN